MGRRSNPIALGALLLAALSVCGEIHAQPPASGRHGRSALPNLRDRFNSLSPEDRQLFRRNAERWMKMGPAEQNIMRQREQMRHARLQQEAEAALRDAGLRLDQQRRELFEQRYLQERRKIERQLLQEIEARRRAQLPGLNDRLKKEFQQSNAAGVSPSNAISSPAPKH